MHRLLVSNKLLMQEDVELPKEAARHLKVLRPKPGEEIELFDGAGATRKFSYAGAALKAAGECVRHEKGERELTLFACVTKGSRWDWTIEKSVELGVNRIVPVLSERTIVRLTTDEREAKAERWRKIAEDAARQSDAVWLPEIVPAVDFAKSLELVKACDYVFVGALTTPPPRNLLACALENISSGAKSLGLFVGPEGDFSPAELSSLLEIAHPTSFGPTILRAETAAIFGMSVLAAALAAQSEC